MKTVHPVFNKHLSALSGADYLKMQPILLSNTPPEWLAQCSVSQFERLLVLLQIGQAEGQGGPVCAPHLKEALHHHVHSQVSPNTAAFWRFQVLISKGEHAQVFEQYHAMKSILNGPISLLMGALDVLDSKLVSNRPLQDSVNTLVAQFQNLAASLSALEEDEIELIERAVFPLQLAKRHELVHQAGKMGAKLKPTETTGIQRKATSHALCIVSADVLLGGI